MSRRFGVYFGGFVLFQDLQLKSMIPICATLTLKSKSENQICKSQIWSVILLQRLCYHLQKKFLNRIWYRYWYFFICRIHFSFPCNFVLHYADLFPRQTDQFLSPLCYIYQRNHPLLELEIILKFKLLEFSMLMRILVSFHFLINIKYWNL